MRAPNQGVHMVYRVNANFIILLTPSHKLRFSNPYIFATLCSKPKIFQTINDLRPINLCLKSDRCIPSDFKDIGIRKLSLCDRISNPSLKLTKV